MTMKIKNKFMFLLIILILSSISFAYSEDVNNQTKIENIDEYDSSSVKLAQNGAKKIDLNSTDTWELEKYNEGYFYRDYQATVTKNPDGTYSINIYGVYRSNGTNYEEFLFNESMIVNAYPKMNYDRLETSYSSNLVSLNPSEYYIAYYLENYTFNEYVFSEIGENVKKLFAKYYRYNNTETTNRALQLAYLYLLNDFPYQKNSTLGSPLYLDPSILVNDSVDTINLAKKMVQDVLSMKKLYTDENNITYYSEGNVKYYFKFYEAKPRPRPSLLSGWNDEMNADLIWGDYRYVIMAYYVYETWDEPINQTPGNNTTENNTPSNNTPNNPITPNTPNNPDDPNNPNTPNKENLNIPIKINASMKSTGIPIIAGLLILISSLGLIIRKKQ